VIRKPQNYLLLAILKCFLAKSLNLAREKKKVYRKEIFQAFFLAKNFQIDENLEFSRFLVTSQI